MPERRRPSRFVAIVLGCGLVAGHFTAIARTETRSYDSALNSVASPVRAPLGPASGHANITFDRDDAALPIAPSPQAAGAVPPPWLSTDVGSPGVSGRAALDADMFMIAGAGADIWGHADQFHYVYQPLTGNTEIVARVASLEPTDVWSKAGVMIRESLTGEAAEASMMVSSANGWGFVQRSAAGAASAYQPGCYCPPAGWVRLTREGDRFSGYQSADGTNWALVATTTIAMPATVYVGLAVTSRNSGATATALFSGVTVGSAANRPPLVALVQPGPSARFEAPAAITLSADASDVDGQVARVDFFEGTRRLGSSSAYPFAMTWSGVAAGSYTLTAAATDDEGATSVSPPVSISVSAGAGVNVPPTVSITTPASGTRFTAPANVTIAAAAADLDGAVARVDFYVLSALSERLSVQLVGSDVTSPFDVPWTNAPVGIYLIVLVATDDSGAAALSESIIVAVEDGPVPSTPTTLLLTPPTDYSTNVTSLTVELRLAGQARTAPPLATASLGKPVVAGGEISADISALVDPLPTGMYYAVVVSTGPGGSTPSSPSDAFAK